MKPTLYFPLRRETKRKRLNVIAQYGPRHPHCQIREVDKLQQWLLDRYTASVFNVCTHQPLPKMSGPKLKLIVDPMVPPVAKHVAAPVPWHLREKVKAGVKADCGMGVVEEVPANTPVEWMSRMITPSKKNGEPRCKVDLSDLNKA